MTVSGTWKRAERVVARFFGAERAPAGSNGRPDRTMSDSTHPRLYIEVKYREKSFVRTVWSDAKKKAKKEKKVPVVGISEKNQNGVLLVIHQDDFDEVARERAAFLERESESDDQVS